MIDVLLATYNGERYLPELLQSLERQGNGGWRLIARDDGSADGTRDLLDAFSRSSARPVRILRDGRSNIGACANFEALLAASDAPYFALCDQDDVWLPEKLDIQLRAIREAEARHGADTPLLAHTDLVVVDGDLNELHPSFWRQQKISRSLRRAGRAAPEARARLVLQNPVTGCAAMGNAALRAAALPIPAEAIMHDWWLALVAGNLGEIVGVDEKTILYRQHGLNTLGAKNRGLPAVLRRFVRAPSAEIQRTCTMIRSTRSQAAAFLAAHAGRLDGAVAGTLRRFSTAAEGNAVYRKTFLLRNGLWPRNWIHGTLLSLYF